MAQGLLLVQVANKLPRTKRPRNTFPPFWILAINVRADDGGHLNSAGRGRGFEGCYEDAQLPAKGNDTPLVSGY